VDQIRKTIPLHRQKENRQAKMGAPQHGQRKQGLQLPQRGVANNGGEGDNVEKKKEKTTLYVGFVHRKGSYQIRTRGKSHAD